MALPRAARTQRRTRIQEEKEEQILEAALEVFSQAGFRGATLDQIADRAGLSKPNLLYYFPSKEAIHVQLIAGLLKVWLDPLRQLDPAGEPVEEILAYIRRKLELGSRYDMTRFDRIALRIAGRFADRHVDRAAPHCKASVRLGLPHDFLFRSPAEQRRLLAA